MSNFDETKVKIDNKIVELINKVRETFESDCTKIKGMASDGTKSKDKIKNWRSDLTNEVRYNPSLKEVFLNEIGEIQRLIVNRDKYKEELNKVRNNPILKSRYENSITNYRDGRCKFRGWVWKEIESISETCVAGQYTREEMSYINEQLEIIKDLLKNKDMLMKNRINIQKFSEYFKMPNNDNEMDR